MAAALNTVVGVILFSGLARTTSLADFWGRRWNTALVGVTGWPFLVFLASGLVHELVISVPAHGGYGLPTAYFLIQGAGVAGERTELGRRLGLGRGWRGWLFAALVAAAPAFWLLLPPFVHQVMLPMLASIGVI